MRNPAACNRGDESCFRVVKRGGCIGVTVGCANEVFSYVRTDYGDKNYKISKEWAILPYINELKFPGMRSNMPSGTGDSGSAVVDKHGRIGGLLVAVVLSIAVGWISAM
jgi:hypothetical protein